MKGREQGSFDIHYFILGGVNLSNTKHVFQSKQEYRREGIITSRPCHVSCTYPGMATNDFLLTSHNMISLKSSAISAPP